MPIIFYILEVTTKNNPAGEDEILYRSGTSSITNDWEQIGDDTVSPSNTVNAIILIWHGANGSVCCNIQGSSTEVDNVISLHHHKLIQITAPNAACAWTQDGLRRPAGDSAPLAGFCPWLFPAKSPCAVKPAIRRADG